MQRFEIISKRRGTTGECVKGAVPLTHCARLLVNDLGKPDIEGIDLGAAEFGRTGLVAGNGTAVAKDIDIGKANMAGHGAKLAAIAVEVKDVARFVTMVATALPQLVHAGNADAWALATWRTSGFEVRCPLCHRLVRHATHRQSRRDRPR